MNLSDLLNADMTTLARLARGGFAWWVRELEELLPAGLVKSRSLAAWHRYEGGQIIAASRRGVDTLVIPEALCLVRTLTLPRMAESDLAALITLDADRIMPVPADSIVLGIRTLGPVEPGLAAAGGEAGADMLRVQVGALPIARARAIAEALGEAGLAPAHVGPLAADGERREDSGEEGIERQSAHRRIRN